MKIMSFSGVLKCVKLEVEYNGSSCTELIFEGDERWYIMTAKFDKDGAITQKAKNLKGQRVKLYSWDSDYEPRDWADKNYFCDIVI